MIELPHPILCRPAGAADTPQALTLTKGIWGGGDYVPEVWEGWLAQSDGLLAVAIWQGRVAGFGHLSDLGLGEAWLEGLRVSPDLQHKGVGSRLHDYFVARWHEGDWSVARLLTHEQREAVRAMCARSGFEPVTRVRFRSGTSTEGAHRFDEVPADDPQAQQSLVGEGTAEACAGLMDLGWELADLTPERIRSTLGIRVWRWNGGVGWLATRRDPTNPDPEITLSAAAGSPLDDLLLDARSLARELGVEQIHWLAPDSPPILAALERAGFDDGEESGAFIVFERRR